MLAFSKRASVQSGENYCLDRKSASQEDRTYGAFVLAPEFQFVPSEATDSASFGDHPAY